MCSVPQAASSTVLPVVVTVCLPPPHVQNAHTTSRLDLCVCACRVWDKATGSAFTTPLLATIDAYLPAAGDFSENPTIIKYFVDKSDSPPGYVVVPGFSDFPGSSTSIYKDFGES